jgi:hypothetical protein
MPPTARNMLKMKAGGLEVGPILMGMGNKAHVVTPSITARGLAEHVAMAGTPVAHYGRAPGRPASREYRKRQWQGRKPPSPFAIAGLLHQISA